MDCQRTRDLLPSHAAGALPARDAAVVTAHLAACPACRDAADAWHAVARSMDRRAVRQAVELPAYRPLPAETGRLTVVGAGGTARHDPPARTRRAASVVAIAAAVAGLLFVAAAVREPDRVARVLPPGAAGRDAALPRVEGPTVVARLATPVRRTGRGGKSPGAPKATGGSSDGAGRGAVVAIASGPISPSAPPASSSPPVTVGHPSPGATESSADSPRLEQQPTRQSMPQPMPQPTQQPTRLPTLGPTLDPTNVAPLPSVAAPTDAPLPMPTATAPPAIAGTVYGGDGVPLGGARVVADRADGGADDGVGGGAGAVDAVEIVVVTDGAGAYTLAVPAGRWIVHVEAMGHGLMWRGGMPSPLDAAADAVDVTAGGGAPIDFHLEPAAPGRIRGQVVVAAGRGVARALVLASPPDRVNGGVGRPAAAVFADADGGYVLPVPPGGWLVAATRDGRGGSPRWWGGDGSLAMADAVAVEATVEAEGIDVQLAE